MFLQHIKKVADGWRDGCAKNGGCAK